MNNKKAQSEVRGPVQDYRKLRIAEMAKRRASIRQTDGPAFRLSIPEGAMDPKLEYRWVNDEKGRIQRLTQEDTWDFTTREELGLAGENSGQGTRLERVVGIGEDGQPLKAYLLCKPKEWAEEDRERRRRPFKQQYAQVLQGKTLAVGEGLHKEAQFAYTPDANRNLEDALSMPIGSKQEH